jgi:hypothetical protein
MLNLVTDNGDDGIVTYDEYCAVYYPNGFTTDLSGTSCSSSSKPYDAENYHS